jgi:hypothetical protein
MHNASASKDKLLNWITLCTHWLSDPEDAVQLAVSYTHLRAHETG